MIVIFFRDYTIMDKRGYGVCVCVCVCECVYECVRKEKGKSGREEKGEID